MPKRGPNIYKRSDNRWEGRYFIFLPDGTKKYISVYARTFAETRDKLLIAKEKARQASTALPECRLTVKELMLNWLAGKQHTVKLSSYLRYEKLVNSQLLPALGQLALKELTAQKITALMQQKSQTGRIDNRGGLAPKTIADILVVVKAVVKTAAALYNLPQAAAILELKAPVCQQKNVENFTDYEVKVICQAILKKPVKNNIAVLLALSCGLRLGEVCALRWQDIDFNAQLLTIRQNVQRVTIEGKSQLLLQTPKSESSRRTVPLTAEIILLLKHLQKEAKGEYVFNGSKPLEPRTLQYHFAAMLKKCNIGSRNFHTLRHTFASRCVAAGADVKTLSELLGHSKVNITMQLYVHPTMEQKRANMESVNILRELCA